MSRYAGSSTPDIKQNSTIIQSIMSEDQKYYFTNLNEAQIKIDSELSHHLQIGDFKKYMDDINGKNKLKNGIIENTEQKDAQIQGEERTKNTIDITQTQNTEKLNQYSSKDKSLSPTFTFQNTQGNKNPIGYLITNKQFTNTSFNNIVAPINVQNQMIKVPTAVFPDNLKHSAKHSHLDSSFKSSDNQPYEFKNISLKSFEQIYEPSPNTQQIQVQLKQNGYVQNKQFYKISQQSINMDESQLHSKNSLNTLGIDEQATASDAQTLTVNQSSYVNFKSNQHLLNSNQNNLKGSQNDDANDQLYQSISQKSLSNIKRNQQIALFDQRKLYQKKFSVPKLQQNNYNSQQKYSQMSNFLGDRKNQIGIGLSEYLNLKSNKFDSYNSINNFSIDKNDQIALKMQLNIQRSMVNAKMYDTKEQQKLIEKQKLMQLENFSGNHKFQYNKQMQNYAIQKRLNINDSQKLSQSKSAMQIKNIFQSNSHQKQKQMPNVQSQQFLNDFDEVLKNYKYFENEWQMKQKQRQQSQLLLKIGNKFQFQSFQEDKKSFNKESVVATNEDTKLNMTKEKQEIEQEVEILSPQLTNNIFGTIVTESSHLVLQKTEDVNQIFQEGSLQIQSNNPNSININENINYDLDDKLKEQEALFIKEKLKFQMKEREQEQQKIEKAERIEKVRQMRRMGGASDIKFKQNDYYDSQKIQKNNLSISDKKIDYVQSKFNSSTFTTKVKQGSSNFQDFKNSQNSSMSNYDKRIMYEQQRLFQQFQKQQSKIVSLTHRKSESNDKDQNQKSEAKISQSIFEEEKKENSDEEIKIEQIFMDKYMMKEHVQKQKRISNIAPNNHLAHKLSLNQDIESIIQNQNKESVNSQTNINVSPPKSPNKPKNLSPAQKEQIQKEVYLKTVNSKELILIANELINQKEKIESGEQLIETNIEEQEQIQKSQYFQESEYEQSDKEEYEQSIQLQLSNKNKFQHIDEEEENEFQKYYHNKKMNQILNQINQKDSFNTLKQFKQNLKKQASSINISQRRKITQKKVLKFQNNLNEHITSQQILYETNIEQQEKQKKEMMQKQEKDFLIKARSELKKKDMDIKNRHQFYKYLKNHKDQYLLLQKYKEIQQKYTIKEWIQTENTEQSYYTKNSNHNNLDENQNEEEKRNLNHHPIVLTQEQKLEQYLKMKQMKIEKKRDKMFKRMLLILNLSKNKIKNKNHLKKNFINEMSEQIIYNSSSKDNFNEDPIISIRTEQLNILTHRNSSDITSKQQQHDKYRSSMNQSFHSESVVQYSLKIAKSEIFDKQNDKNEALEYNQKDLPEDYLIAKFSFTNDEKIYYQNAQEDREPKIFDRRNTQYYFDRADIYHESQDSFNQMFQSEIDPIPNVNEGLTSIMQDFQKKSQFFKSVKNSNKSNIDMQNNEKEGLRNYVVSSLNFNDLPLPVLFKIKKGILFIPGLYKISEGLSQAILEGLRDQTLLVDTNLQKVILKQNNMNDTVHSNLLKGIGKRKTLTSLNTQNNEIGEQSTTQICKLIEGKDEQATQDQNLPILTELKIIKCKCETKSIDKIILQISQTQYLRKLSLQQMQLSERQLKIVLDFIRNSNLIEIDISWNKITYALLGILFQALELNRTVQNLNLSWIQMGGSLAHIETLEKHFNKFCTFIKENQKLIHINLSSVNLPEKYMIELICNLKRSQSLHCVHLCGNQFTEACIDMLNLKLKPTFINNMIMKQEVLDYKKQIIARIQNGLKSKYKERYEKIYDSVLIKEILFQWHSVQTEYQHCNIQDPNYLPLILSKQLGHPEILNSKHWKITNECYQCEKWKYTIIFWDLKNQGLNYQIKDPLLEEMIEEMILNSNPQYKDLKKQNQRQKVFIAGSFTDWQPRKMILLDELIAIYQKKDGFAKDRDRRLFFYNQIKYNWRKVLKNDLPYGESGTQYINFPELNLFDSKNPPHLDHNQLFVYCDFVKPGKHEYIVTYENNIKETKPVVQVEESPLLKKKEQLGSITSKQDFSIQISHRKSQSDINSIKLSKQQSIAIDDDFNAIISNIKLTSYHQFVGEAFINDYNINTKVNEFDKVDRFFDKNKSVFKDWKLDNQKQIQEGFLEEISHWNVPNFVKDEEEYKNILNLMKDNSSFLKTLFIIRSSMSNYPVIRWLNYAPLITDFEIFDSNFDMSSVDRIFISVTKNMDPALRGILPEKDMSRFQFYESLVRIGLFKYKLGNITKSVYEGLKILIEDVLIPKYDNYIWMPFREQKLWCLEIDDLYKANLVAMNKLYKYYFDKKKTKIYYYEDAIDMFTHDIELELLPEQISQCWGLSKMTVNNDIKQRSTYFQVQFVEFLEFFSRLAFQKFREGPYKGDSLVEKILRLMDIVFPLINMKRKEVKIEIEYMSVSEDDLIEEKYFD